MRDHFCPNSVVDHKISTHHLNLPHHGYFEIRPAIVADDQHSEFEWFDLKVVANNEAFHTHMGNYADWLIKKWVNTDD